MTTTANFKNKRFAVFDIDGTIYRWQFFHEIVHELASMRVLPEGALEKIDEAFRAWRSSEISYDEYELIVVEIFVSHLANIPIIDYDIACQKVIERSQHKLYYYPRQLITKLKADGYVLIALSGSQQEIVELFGKRYEFDIAIGVEYEREGGRFTGKITRQIVGRKGSIMKEIIEQYELDTSGSIAIGDSAGDATILELVEKPIAFNPASGLFARAEQEGWSIVIERKNMAYRLEKRGADLILAETIVY